MFSTQCLKKESIAEGFRFINEGGKVRGRHVCFESKLLFYKRFLFDKEELKKWADSWRFVVVGLSDRKRCLELGVSLLLS